MEEDDDFLRFAVAISMQKKVRNVTRYDASTVANGCPKTVATIIFSAPSANFVCKG
jgi:hypothetical protein